MDDGSHDPHITHDSPGRAEGAAVAAPEPSPLLRALGPLMRIRLRRFAAVSQDLPLRHWTTARRP